MSVPEIRKTVIHSAYKITYWTNNQTSYTCRICGMGTTGPEGHMPLHIADHLAATLGICPEVDAAELDRPYPVEIDETALAAGVKPANPEPPYGIAGTRRLDDGTIVVDHADPAISITRELLKAMRADGLGRPGGRICLDTAGVYEYAFYADFPSPLGVQQDVLVYRRVHRGWCYETSPVECSGCECWCHGATE